MSRDPQPVAKVHPASREMLADDPLELQAFEVPGHADLMLRLLVEEYARIGWGTEAIMKLARDPNYAAFHRLFRAFGEHQLRRRVAQVISRCGVTRVHTTEENTQPCELRLVQIELPQSPTGGVSPS